MNMYPRYRLARLAVIVDDLKIGSRNKSTCKQMRGRMPTNDDRVSQFIAWANSSAAGSADACCGQTCAAFRILQAERRKPGKSLDLDLAAAEHYMFARCMVCTGTVSKTQMKALTIGYDLKKHLDRATGDPNKEATTSNPVSPPDWDVVEWGLAGANDGDDDHDRCNSGAHAPLWRPLEQVFGPGKGVGPY
jgi:hypothetical protein